MTRSDRVRVDTATLGRYAGAVAGARPPRLAGASAARTVASPRSPLAGARPIVACAVAVLLAGAVATCAHAELRDIDARVVWSRAAYFYVAAPDSGQLAPGMMLAVRRGDRELAMGRIERLYEPRLALVRLDSGSLEGEEHLDALRVRGEAALDLLLTRLRVGLPARERHSLLFACDAPAPDTTFAREHYRTTPLGGGLRLLRVLESPGLPVAPDTLDVTFFSDATDAEIALERGDLDVAVFWPGELSARLRGGEHAAHVFAGQRAHGVLAVALTAPDSLPLPPSDVAWLAREAFAGDLLPCATSAGEPAAARYRVDAALPGARVLERALSRVNRASARRTVTLRYLADDVAPGGAGDSAAEAAAWRVRGLQPLFAMQCRVASTARTHALVAAIGAGAFADLVSCAKVPR